MPIVIDGTGTISGVNATGISTAQTVNASSITSGTVAAANGGTGLTSPGTAGNVLTSNGTAWTSAAASGSPLVFLNTTLVSSAVSAVTFTGLDNSTYISFMLEYENLISDVGGQAVCLQLGTNSGLQSNYSGSVITNNNSSTSLAFSNSTSDSYLRITTSDTRADSLGGVNGIAWISNINSTSAPAVRAHSNYFNSNNGNSYNSLASGNAPTSYSVTRVSIRFVPAVTINISSGRVTIYGLKAS
jgi:hypothetical protein